MDATNPYVIVCNLYNNTDAIRKGLCKEPKQIEEQLDLWETAACGEFFDLCQSSVYFHTYISFDHSDKDKKYDMDTLG
jgi:hypothetical protein